MRPDKFKEHYNALSPQDQISLIKLSGHYNDNGTQLMLNVPEVTKRLIEVCLPPDVSAHIKRFIKSKDEDFVRNYCKKKLFLCRNTSLLATIKKPITQLRTRYSNWVYNTIHNSIPFNSLFINGYYAHNQPLSPIPLFINDTLYQTFGYNFINDDCELRITGIKSSPLALPLSKECLLWVINHDDPELTYATKIKHNDTIKGCCFSKTGTNTEYVVTYSEKELVFSKIIMEPDKLPIISSIQAIIPNDGTIVHAAFNHATNQVAVTTDEKYNSLFTYWNMDGTCGSSGAWPQRTHGFLELVFFGKKKVDDVLLDIVTHVFNGMGIYSLYEYDISASVPTFLSSRCAKIQELRAFYDVKVDKRGDTTCIYDVSCSPFAAIIKAENKRAQGGFFENLKNDFCFEPDDECFRRYSPDGTLLMSNSLKKKSGILYVETCIQDAKNHQPIMTIDTLYQNFAGVGFNDQLELVFFNHKGPDEKVFLWNSDDKKRIEEFEALACCNSGVASVIKRLCEECDQSGYVVLLQDDPVRAMLMDWARTSPTMLKFLEKCLPIKKQ